MHSHKLLRACTHSEKINSTEVQNPRHKMQVALFAEPKVKHVYYHTMSSGNEICWHFCTHHEALLYATALYTLLKLKRYISVTHARRITSVVCGRNAEIA